MEWSDNAIVLATRPHGETSAILEVFSSKHGRYAGLVRGGRSKSKRPILQAGNLVVANWRARLPEHLGTFSVELLEAHAALALDNRMALAGLETLTALLRLLPERDPHERLFDASLMVVRALDQEDVWPALLVRWELELLNELGFGLDLESCAATGEQADLTHVSPKSGRAVSRAAGAPYADKLLALPGFLKTGQTSDLSPNVGDVVEGFALTSYFYRRHIWEPRGLEPPQSRMRLITLLNK